MDRCIAELPPAERELLLAALAPSVLDPRGDALPARSGAALPGAAGAHLAAVRERFAPERLLDREEELAELVEFCAGDQRYLWWQAAPWAGKTALMSSFVLEPPSGVDVASFFVTRRHGPDEAHSGPWRRPQRSPASTHVPTRSPWRCTPVVNGPPHWSSRQPPTCV
ncbi:hypothetical protein [Streptomyces marispadix]|uniref:Uncharacterized protein n=1 Tax=Streptomyces marispadix TaxID=2922868 RepID=A0ABS9SUR7_9ACTN|nr:hypothetical protein [Streptomyces marispadix]MCH6159908.1 hypothetical protein [Streptomyces marispadix]